MADIGNEAVEKNCNAEEEERIEEMRRRERGERKYK